MLKNLEKSTALTIVLEPEYIMDDLELKLGV